MNPLFEVFDGGDLILSSYRDIERPLTEMRIFVAEESEVEKARQMLKAALDIVGVGGASSDSHGGLIETCEVADEDWRFAYRRHFKTEQVSERIFTVPEWEAEEFAKSGRLGAGQIAIVSDPGMAFGTGKHETTRACLEYIDALSPAESFLDMGTGSGILSIAAAKLGCDRVTAFDVDQDAVGAAQENAAKNNVNFEVFKYGLGANVKRELPVCDLVVANILGPLLIRFADEIAPTVGRHLIISGILTELYEEVLKAYTDRGFKEVSRRTIGEWTTGRLEVEG